MEDGISERVEPVDALEPLPSGDIKEESQGVEKLEKDLMSEAVMVDTPQEDNVTKAPAENQEPPVVVKGEKETASEEAKLCKGFKKNGEPCTLLALSDGCCFAHSPAMAEKRKAAYARGGANSSKAARLQKLMPARMGPVNDMLENILKELYEHKIDPRTAQAIAAVSRVLVSSFASAEVEDRLRKLEEEDETNQ